jgi:pyruvate carboxylase
MSFISIILPSHNILGGIIEAAVCYTGDVTKQDARYNLEYYVGFARQLVELGAHVIAIKVCRTTRCHFRVLNATRLLDNKNCITCTRFYFF